MGGGEWPFPLLAAAGDGVADLSCCGATVTDGGAASGGGQSTRSLCVRFMRDARFVAADRCEVGGMA